MTANESTGAMLHQPVLADIESLLNDGKPLTLRQLSEETGIENIPAPLLQKLARLPDNRYTVPDSDGAREFFWDYLREKPRHLQSVLRFLRKHESIKADILSALAKQEQLVRLPRGLITTCDSPAGRSIIAKRLEIKLCEDILSNYPTPFFTLENAGVSRNVPGHVIDRYAVAVSFNGNEMLCLRRDFPGNVINEQLKQLTGRSLKTHKKVSARILLKNASMGENEVLDILNIGEEILRQLIQEKSLDTVKLNGELRFWRKDIERLRQDTALLQDAAKRQNRFNVPQTAVLLGLSIGQVKRLIDEAHLKSSLHDQQTETAGPLFTGGDIDRLQKKLPDILYRWRYLRNKGRIPAANSDNKPLPLRRRIEKPELREVTPRALQLDDFQSKAIQALRANRSVLLSAPTGNGKTLVAEILAQDLMGMGKSLIYTSPLKALSNQKYRDFKSIFGEERIGLVTGDVNVNPKAPLMIMTTEIFRNWCIGEQEQLSNTVFVIFDEFHYLDDSDRGTTWEESILFAPAHIKFLGLSATVPNISEIADWISAVRGEDVVIIEETTRQVPLNICWLSYTGQMIGENQAQQEVKELVDYQKAFRNRKHWAVDR